MGTYQNPPWPDGQSPDRACSCDEAFAWPRGVAFDGENYRCPSCKGVIARNLVSDHKIIPRSEYLGLNPLEMVASVNSPISSTQQSQSHSENRWRNLFFIIVVGLVALVIASNSSQDGYLESPVLVSDQAPPVGGSQTPAPSVRNYYYEEPCEDTFTREQYQDCLEDLWMKDYELDMKYNFGEP